MSFSRFMLCIIHLQLLVVMVKSYGESFINQKHEQHPWYSKLNVLYICDLISQTKFMSWYIIICDFVVSNHYNFERYINDDIYKCIRNQLNDLLFLIVLDINCNWIKTQNCIDFPGVAKYFTWCHISYISINTSRDLLSWNMRATVLYSML